MSNMKGWIHYTVRGWRDEFTPFDDNDTFYGVCFECGHIMALSDSEVGIASRGFFMTTSGKAEFDCNMCGEMICASEWDTETKVYDCKVSNHE